MQLYVRLSACVALAMLAGAELHAQPEHETALKASKQVQPDLRLSSALDAAGIAYATLQSGDLQVRARLADGRHQSVVLRSQTHAYRREEWREIYAIAHSIDDEAPLDAALARRLLAANDTLVMGAWSFDNPRVTLIVRLPARSSPLRVAEAIDFVAEVADGLELELGHEDRF